LPGIVRQMRDQIAWEGVGTLAEGQAGFLTPRQARELGVDRDALAYHARPGGRLKRAARGLYRLWFFPRSPFDHAAAAWVATGPDEAVVSHESALELYELADVIPNEVHLTLSRERRSLDRSDPGPSRRRGVSHSSTRRPRPAWALGSGAAQMGLTSGGTRDVAI